MNEMRFGHEHQIWREFVFDIILGKNTKFDINNMIFGQKRQI
jgi:hypothetical protein